MLQADRSSLSTVNVSARAAQVFGSNLYVSTGSGQPPAPGEIWRTDGVSWTQVVNGVLWYNSPVTLSQSTTAAMDTGVDADVTADVDGHLRLYNTIPDLGADEVVATPVPTDTASSLVYTDTQESSTTIQVPADAVTETIVLVYAPVDTATAPADSSFANRAFDLDAYRGGTLLPGFTFSAAVTITLHYVDADVAGLDEDTLLLEYWNEGAGAWEDAANTCAPPSAYDRHPDANWLAVPICHLTRFALFGRGYTVYLPLVMRAYP